MKKLRLNDLKVKSFVTELKSNEAKTVQGGSGNSLNPVCMSQVPACQTQACSVVAACPTPTPPIEL